MRLRNISGSDLEVAPLNSRVVKAGDVIDVAGELVDGPADDAWHVQHPWNADGDIRTWDKATWDVEAPAKPAKSTKE